MEEQTIETLICGSLAYDTVLTCEGVFADGMSQTQLPKLNLSVTTPHMRRGFGGCAGNISFWLNMLQGEPRPMATLGMDHQPYTEWLEKRAIAVNDITHIDTEYTAQAFITTDREGSQICAFHPGAMAMAHVNDIRTAKRADIAILSPDAPRAMVEHGEQLAQCGTPFIFDPGQALAELDMVQIRMLVDRCTWMTVNEHEWDTVRERSGLDASTIIRSLEALVVTKGSEGLEVHTQSDTHMIACAQRVRAIDPTGCGDAARAGLLHAINNSMSWADAGRLAGLLGAMNIEREGSQNPAAGRWEVEQRVRATVGK